MYIIQSGSHRDLRDVGVRVKAKSLWGVNHWQVGNEGEVLIEFIAFRYRVALVEAEVVGEHVLAKPGATERVQQTLVIVIRHTAAILYLSKHVPNGTPTHTLQSTSDMFTHSESLHRHSNGGVTDRQTFLGSMSSRWFCTNWILALKSEALNSYGMFQPSGPNFRRS